MHWHSYFNQSLQLMRYMYPIKTSSVKCSKLFGVHVFDFLKKYSVLESTPKIKSFQIVFDMDNMNEYTYHTQYSYHVIA